MRMGQAELPFVHAVAATSGRVAGPDAAAGTDIVRAPTAREMIERVRAKDRVIGGSGAERPARHGTLDPTARSTLRY